MHKWFSMDSKIIVGFILVLFIGSGLVPTIVTKLKRSQKPMSTAAEPTEISTNAASSQPEQTSPETKPDVNSNMKIPSALKNTTDESPPKQNTRQKLSFIDPFPKSRSFQWYFKKETPELGAILKPTKAGDPVEFVGQDILTKISQLNKGEKISMSTAILDTMTEKDPDNHGVFFQNQKASIDQKAAQFEASVPICFVKPNSEVLNEIDPKSIELIFLDISKVLDLQEIGETNRGYRIEFQTKTHKLHRPAILYIDCFLASDSPASLAYTDLSLVHLYAALGVRGMLTRIEH